MHETEFAKLAYLVLNGHYSTINIFALSRAVGWRGLTSLVRVLGTTDSATATGWVITEVIAITNTLVTVNITSTLSVLTFVILVIINIVTVGIASSLQILQFVVTAATIYVQSVDFTFSANINFLIIVMNTLTIKCYLAVADIIDFVFSAKTITIIITIILYVVINSNTGTIISTGYFISNVTNSADDIAPAVADINTSTTIVFDIIIIGIIIVNIITITSISVMVVIAANSIAIVITTAIIVVIITIYAITKLVLGIAKLITIAINYSEITVLISRAKGRSLAVHYIYFW